MNFQLLSSLLSRHPKLHSSVEKGYILTGYTVGGQRGEQIDVFLLSSPWRDYCLTATAHEVIPQGAVLVVSQDEPWCLQGNWQAYQWNDSQLLPQDVSHASLVHLATQIALEASQQTTQQPLTPTLTPE